jgi:SET family sugar efflux transporter-like MFS transporter
MGTAAAGQTAAPGATRGPHTGGGVQIGVGRPLPGLLVAVLLLGVADSITGPYLVLFGADRARLSPLAIGVFMSLTGISGMAVSTWLGRRYDRGPSRLPALLALTASAVGYGLLTLTTSYALLLLIAAVFLGTGTAAFPQLFALARHHLDRAGTTARGTPALRSMWSMAWAIGPMAGGAILAWQGFTALFLLAAAAFASVALPVLWLGAPPTTAASAATTDNASAPLTRPLVPVAIAFGLFHTAMFAGSVVLPLYVTEQLRRPYGDVGLMFSVCAAVELLAALALTRLPANANRERLILVGFGLFIAYFAIIAAASNAVLIVVAQAARGAAISAVLALGITYFQDLLPRQPGRATTMLSNTAVAGSLLSGILAGTIIQALGYRAALTLCAALSLTGAILLLAARHHGTTQDPRTLQDTT